MNIRFEDKKGSLFLMHGKICCTGKAISFLSKESTIVIPCGIINTLMLGPGTSITSSAVRKLTNKGVQITWSDENGLGCHTTTTNRNSSNKNIIKQINHYSDNEKNKMVIEKMYKKILGENIEVKDVETMWGIEGNLTKQFYQDMANKYNVQWFGRMTNQKWETIDDINKAITMCNYYLYNRCLNAIKTMNYSPAIGFIHSGKMYSFVYDISDFYKRTITIPLSFKLISEGYNILQDKVYNECYLEFKEKKLNKQIITDIEELFL